MERETLLFSLNLVKLLQSTALLCALFLTVSAAGLSVSNYHTVQTRGWVYEVQTTIGDETLVQTVYMKSNYYFNAMIWIMALINWALFVYLRCLSFYIENIN